MYQYNELIMYIRSDDLFHKRGIRSIVIEETVIRTSHVFCWPTSFYSVGVLQGQRSPLPELTTTGHSIVGFPGIVH